MLTVNQLSFKYNKKPVLNAINFVAQPGEHISIIGESGSGKSTLLKLIYGELDALSGTIFWNDNQILGPAHNLVIGPEFMKYVSQEFNLMPFTSVGENVGKHLSNFFLNKKDKRIDELLEVVELSAFKNTKVKYLSGGQKQRVALARALAKQPKILLLDEPFSHIDTFKTQSLRRNLFNYLKAQNITCLVATHNKNDVLGFSNRILVLNDTEIIANNTPEVLYNNPKTDLIAAFFGEFNYLETYGYVYAHQLQIDPSGTLQATVKQSYFKGYYYLIEALYKDKLVYINHTCALDNGSEIRFKVIY